MRVYILSIGHTKEQWSEILEVYDSMDAAITAIPEHKHPDNLQWENVQPGLSEEMLWEAGDYSIRLEIFKVKKMA